MVFTDQCSLPTRSPGSSRGFSNISVLARRNNCGYLLLLNGFGAGFQGGSFGKL